MAVIFACYFQPKLYSFELSPEDPNYQAYVEGAPEELV